MKLKRIIFLSVNLIFTIYFFSSCNNTEEELFRKNNGEINETQLSHNKFFVSKEEGIKVANAFYRKLGKHTSTSFKEQMTRSNEIPNIESISKNGKTLMYVINYSDSGFVIISATKDYYPIIAYSDDNNIDINNGNLGLSHWLENAKTEIEASSKKNDSIKNKMRSLWDEKMVPLNQTRTHTTRSGSLTEADIACYMRCEEYLNQYGYEGDQGWHFVPLSDAQQAFKEKGFESIYQNLCYSAEFNHSLASNSVLGYKICTVKRKVGPLLSTKWHQQSPFNDYCNGNPAGCAAIAVAQVMNYYKYPGAFSFNGMPFDWSTIPNEPNANSSQGLLVAMVGSIINTHYNKDYSWSTPGSVEEGMEKIGYNVSTGDDDWFQVQSSILSGKSPVIMLGNDDNWSFLPGNLKYLGDSHYWVCDGVDETTMDVLFLFTEWQPYGKGNFVPGWNSINQPYQFGGQGYYYFHINWGWGGLSNGWFADVSNSKKGDYDNNNDRNSNQGHYKNSRKNFYISIKR